MRAKNSVAFNKLPVVPILFFLIAAVLLYLSSRLFFYDEDIFVVNTLTNFMSDFKRAPVVKISFIIDNFLYGTKATGYHVTNILLHLCNTVLATYTFRELLNSAIRNRAKGKIVSNIFFLLFLLSPIHSEPLCYVLGRAGLVVTFFCISSLLFFLKANFSNYRFLLASLFFFLAALYSYEVSWTFPFIILITGNYLRMQMRVQARSFFIYIGSYFLVFIFWFLIQIIFINRLNIIPYGNNVFSSFHTLPLLKNAVVMFFRNMVPPFASTVTFVTISSVVGLLFLYAFLTFKFKSKLLYSLFILTLGAAIFAFAPCIVFGINSHDSESERYIYFSSVFIIMCVSLGFLLLNNLKTIQLTMAIVCCIYAGFLFLTVGNYIRGGNFSKKYLDILAAETGKLKYNYLINQPSQYNGALLFRAFSSKGSGFPNMSTTQDFMYSLYKKHNTDYITLSKKEVRANSSISNVIHISIDSLSSIFTEFHVTKEKDILVNSLSGDSILFDSSNSVIIGLKLPSAYIFK